tara:strand:- start:2718 stop:4502 length:1785 start_codon:yes stop_codon:yes gene_type:complete
MLLEGAKNQNKKRIRRRRRGGKNKNKNKNRNNRNGGLSDAIGTTASPMNRADDNAREAIRRVGKNAINATEQQTCKCDDCKDSDGNIRTWAGRCSGISKEYCKYHYSMDTGGGLYKCVLNKKGKCAMSGGAPNISGTCPYCKEQTSGKIKKSRGKCNGLLEHDCEQFWGLDDKDIPRPCTWIPPDNTPGPPCPSTGKCSNGLRCEKGEYCSKLQNTCTVNTDAEIYCPDQILEEDEVCKSYLESKCKLNPEDHGDSCRTCVGEIGNVLLHENSCNQERINDYCKASSKYCMPYLEEKCGDAKKGSDFTAATECYDCIGKLLEKDLEGHGCSTMQEYYNFCSDGKGPPWEPGLGLPSLLNGMYPQPDVEDSANPPDHCPGIWVGTAPLCNVDADNEELNDKGWYGDCPPWMQPWTENRLGKANTYSKTGGGVECETGHKLCCVDKWSRSPVYNNSHGCTEGPDGTCNPYYFGNPYDPPGKYSPPLRNTAVDYHDGHWHWLDQIGEILDWHSNKGGWFPLPTKPCAHGQKEEPGVCKEGACTCGDPCSDPRPCPPNCGWGANSPGAKGGRFSADCQCGAGSPPPCPPPPPGTSLSS